MVQIPRDPGVIPGFFCFGIKAVDFHDRIEESVDFLGRNIGSAPRAAIVLGTGFGQLFREMESECILSYDAVPNFLPTTIAGHEGRLKIVTFNGGRCCILAGRSHLYEGVAVEEVVHPVRSLSLWGVQRFMLTNAAGAVNPAFRPGHLMVIRDHLNLTGANPLIGANHESLGPRFPDMTKAYSPRLLGLARRWAKEYSAELREGVYAAVVGPNFETPAEISMLRVLGADAVGMSTVPEVIALNHMSSEVLAVSGISNVAAVASRERVEHSEVAGVIAGMQEPVRSLAKWFVAGKEDRKGA